MKKVFVDTNIFLRFLLADHPKQSPACKKLFEKASKGKITLVTLPIVIAEICWVLHTYYKESRREVSEKLKVILLFKGLDLPHQNILIMACEIFESKNMDFLDAYIAAWLKSKDINSIYSYDKDYNKIGGIRRMEPTN